MVIPDILLSTVEESHFLFSIVSQFRQPATGSKMQAYEDRTQVRGVASGVRCGQPLWTILLAQSRREGSPVEKEAK